MRLTEPLGANTLLHGKIAGSREQFTISLPGVHPFASVGGDMRFRVQDGQAHLFDPATGHWLDHARTSAGSFNPAQDAARLSR